MTHTGSPKKVIFTLDDVEITEILNGKVIAKGVVDHTSKVYMFSHFLPYSNPSNISIHANEESKLWNEIFGHINYKYLYDLSEKEMVIGFVARISPCYRGRNGSLPSIGRKGRFLLENV